MFKDCPCGENCISGCEDCENTICELHEKAVLLLSTYSSFNKPMIIDFNGRYGVFGNTAYDGSVSKNFLGNFDDNLNFEYGKDTEIVDGCGVTFLGEFWYFGGFHNDQVFSY